MIINIEIAFEIGDIVYLVHDNEQLKRQVVSIKINPGHSIMYGIICVDKDQWAYDFELSENKVYVH